MTAFLLGLAAWIAITVLGLFGGRNEPTAHGQGVIFHYACLFGFYAACICWVIGLLFWIF